MRTGGGGKGRVADDVWLENRRRSDRQRGEKVNGSVGEGKTGEEEVV